MWTGFEIRFTQRENGRFLTTNQPCVSNPWHGSMQDLWARQTLWLGPSFSFWLSFIRKKMRPTANEPLAHKFPHLLGGWEEATAHGQLLLAVIWPGHNCPPQVSAPFHFWKMINHQYVNFHKRWCSNSMKPSVKLRDLAQNLLTHWRKLTNRFVYVVLTQ